MNVMARKLNATHNQLQQMLEAVLVPLWRVNPTQKLYQQGLDLRVRFGFHFYDSLIIAAAQHAGCHTLYSEDLQHGQQIDGLTIVNPFADPADAITKPRRGAKI